MKDKLFKRIGFLTQKKLEKNDNSVTRFKMQDFSIRILETAYDFNGLYTDLQPSESIFRVDESRQKSANGKLVKLFFFIFFHTNSE